MADRHPLGGRCAHPIMAVHNGTAGQRMVFLDTVMPSSVDASTVSMFWIGVPPRERASRSMRIGRSVGTVTRPGKGSGGPQRPRQDRRKSDVGVAGVCEARRVVRSGRYPVTTLAGPPAWLAAGGTPHNHKLVVQQCDAGLVRVRCDGPRLEFAAPPLRRTGALSPDLLAKIADALALPPSDIVHNQWVDNGPGWCAVMLRSARQVLSLRPAWALLDPLQLGVIGPHEPGHIAAVEVRAFIGDAGYEDPVTGSLNASLAQWLIGAGVVNSPYIAAQGAALQRAGLVHLRRDGEGVWVGGDVTDVVRGDVYL